MLAFLYSSGKSIKGQLVLLRPGSTQPYYCLFSGAAAKSLISFILSRNKPQTRRQQRPNRRGWVGLLMACRWIIDDYKKFLCAIFLEGGEQLRSLEIELQLNIISPQPRKQNVVCRTIFVKPVRSTVFVFDLVWCEVLQNNVGSVDKPMSTWDWLSIVDT